MNNDESDNSSRKKSKMIPLSPKIKKFKPREQRIIGPFNGDFESENLSRKVGYDWLQEERIDTKQSGKPPLNSFEFENRSLSSFRMFHSKEQQLRFQDPQPSTSRDRYWNTVLHQCDQPVFQLYKQHTSFDLPHPSTHPSFSRYVFSYPPKQQDLDDDEDDDKDEDDDEDSEEQEDDDEDDDLEEQDEGTSKDREEEVNVHRCPHCGGEFGWKKNLVVHIRVVHERKKDFECSFCHMKFGTKSNMKKHIISVHIGEKSYKCEICLKTFTFAYNLRNHMKRVHKIDTD